jgi:hypothetical protein
MGLKFLFMPEFMIVKAKFVYIEYDGHPISARKLIARWSMGVHALPCASP